jgi:hypothetical protein
VANIAYVPTDKDRSIVKAMASYGIPQEDIGRVIGISHVTLRKYYEAELDTAGIQANAKVAETCYALATSGHCPAATFFWLKTRAGWREVERVEHVGEDGGAVKVIVEYEDRPPKASLASPRTATGTR